MDSICDQPWTDKLRLYFNFTMMTPSFESQTITTFLSTKCQLLCRSKITQKVKVHFNHQFYNNFVFKNKTESNRIKSSCQQNQQQISKQKWQIKWQKKQYRQTWANDHLQITATIHFEVPFYIFLQHKVTYKLRPSVNNGHYFRVRRVIVVHRFDYTSEKKFL